MEDTHRGIEPGVSPGDVTAAHIGDSVSADYDLGRGEVGRHPDTHSQCRAQSCAASCGQSTHTLLHITAGTTTRTCT